MYKYHTHHTYWQFGILLVLWLGLAIASSFAGSCSTFPLWTPHRRRLSVHCLLMFSTTVSVKLRRALHIPFYICYIMTFISIPFIHLAWGRPNSCLASFFSHWRNKHVLTTSFILQEVQRAHKAWPCTRFNQRRQTRLRLFVPQTCIWQGGVDT